MLCLVDLKKKEIVLKDLTEKMLDNFERNGRLKFAFWAYFTFFVCSSRYLQFDSVTIYYGGHALFFEISQS